MKSQLNIVTSTVAAAFVFAAATCSPVWAEQTVRYEPVPRQSNVRIDGTSNAHDWTVEGKTIDGYAEFRADVAAGAPAEEVKAALIANPQGTVDVQIPVKSIHGDDKGLDKKMYEALKEEDHPTITYQLTEATVPDGTTSEQYSFDLQTKGKLTVAGKTRDLEMPMTVEVLDGDRVKFSGSVSLKMTDFNVKPPQALLGLIKSGNTVQVKVEWELARAVGGEAAEPETGTATASASAAPQ